MLSLRLPRLRSFQRISSHHIYLSTNTAVGFLPSVNLHATKKRFSAATFHSYGKLSSRMRADWNADDSLFRYTSGRWLFDEAEQLAARSVKFDMNELVSRATEALVQPADACRSVQKLGEGQFNKAYLMTMEDGSEVVAKVPHPNAGMPHFTTASEVATMEFARTVLEIPLPKVLAWSSQVDETSVGAEYIIMERASGDPLRKHWEDMDHEDRNKILQQIIAWEVAFTAHPFQLYGNIYFSSNLSSEILARQDPSLYPGFGIGPICNRYFFNDGRGSIETDRGPWHNLEDYLIAIAHREIRAIKNVTKLPRPKYVTGYPGAYERSEEGKLAALHDYLKIVKYLVPKSGDLRTAVLWHQDLNLDNIFVDPEQPTKILAVIDWQSAYVGPLFEQVTRPAFLTFSGPKYEDKGLPALPENFDELTSEAQKEAKKLVGDQALYIIYEASLAERHPAVHKALRYRDTVVSAHIMALANIIFNEGEILLLRNLMDIAESQNWAKIVGKSGDPCPLSYSSAKVVAQRENEEKWLAGVELMDDLIESLGGVSSRGRDGFVKNEEYEEAQRMLELVRKQFIEHHAHGRRAKEGKLWRKAWPFSDIEEE